jgi:hypothetical protein
MVFVEGDDYRALRRPGDDPAQFRSPVRLPRSNVLDAAVTSGLVAWYRFEDSTDTAIDATNALGVGANQTAFDGTVNGASFVPNGGVTDVVSGPNSGAYSFDGVDDFVDIGNIPSIQNESAISFGGWLKNPQNNVDTEMIGNFASSRFNDAISIAFLDETPPGISFQIAAGAASAEVRAQKPQDTDYHHYFLTFNSGTTTAYIDGSQVGKTTNSSVQTTPSIPLTLMTRDFKGEFVDSTADDVRFYNRTLSASENNQIYQNTKP